MEQMSFLSAVFLVILGQWQGFTALTSVFVQTGKDLVLDVKGADCSEDNALISWKFNQKVVLVRLTCNKSGKPTVIKFQDGAEITEKTSLKLKNCQKSFSGVYSAVRSSDKEEVVAEYNVTVEDPVSPGHLKVDTVNTSDVCGLNVTCSTNHSKVSSSFTCDTKTCKQDNGQQTDAPKQGNLLRIYLSDGSVICNHSNQVSWANSTDEIKRICSLDNENTNSPQLIIWVIISVCFILMIIIGIAVFFFIRKRRPKGPEGPKDVTSIYSLVQPHTPMQPSPVPDTVYAQIQKSGRPSQTPEVCT